MKNVNDSMANTKCCPIDNTFKLIGKRFTVHILRNMMMMGQTRFNEFLDSIEDVNPKTLSARLRELEKSRLIERKVYNETPIRIEYHLTEKGQKLRSILEQMAAFSMRYCCSDIFKDGKPRTLRQGLGVAPTIIK
ncbi:MAG TPA: helix-turn-helix domain-containing protein [Nitrosopumilaceae archaeon]|nr:helix-turn-helix domain-containing protein [Nitrosopumilaceae archaeon]